MLLPRLRKIEPDEIPIAKRIFNFVDSFIVSSKYSLQYKKELHEEMFIGLFTALLWADFIPLKIPQLIDWNSLDVNVIETYQFAYRVLAELNLQGLSEKHLDREEQISRIYETFVDHVSTTIIDSLPDCCRSQKHPNHNHIIFNDKDLALILTDKQKAILYHIYYHI